MATQEQLDQLVSALAARTARPRALAEIGPKLTDGRIELTLEIRSGMNTAENQRSLEVLVADKADKLGIAGEEIAVAFSDYVAKTPQRFSK